MRVARGVLGGLLAVSGAAAVGAGVAGVLSARHPSGGPVGADARVAPVPAPSRLPDLPG